MEIPEEEEKGTESIFKGIMAENFQNLRREMNIQRPKESQIQCYLGFQT